MQRKKKEKDNWEFQQPTTAVIQKFATINFLVELLMQSVVREERLLIIELKEWLEGWESQVVVVAVVVQVEELMVLRLEFGFELEWHRWLKEEVLHH